MLKREKIIVISDILDNSIQSTVPFYEILVFPTFMEAENYLSVTPESIQDLFLTERDLSFNSLNAIKLKTLLKSPFLSLTGSAIYLLYPDKNLEVVRKVFEEEGDKIQFYNTDITRENYINFIKGISRQDVEENTEVVTYRMRKDEYLANKGELRYDSDDLKYFADDEELSKLPEVQQPVDLLPISERIAKRVVLSGKMSMERSVMMFLIAQYLSQTGKVIIIDEDVKYHRLTEIVSKSDVHHKFIEYGDFTDNIKETLDSIKYSSENLIVVGLLKNTKLDFGFVLEMLSSNLSEDVDYILYAKELKDINKIDNVSIVVPNTIPDLLETIGELTVIPDPEKVIFVGVQSTELGPINISTKEIKVILEYLFQKIGYSVQLLKINGTILGGNYDIQSIISK